MLILHIQKLGITKNHRDSFFKKKQKKICHKIYKIDKSFNQKTLKKSSNGLLEDEIAYTKKLITTIRKEDKIICFPYIPYIKEDVDMLEELVEDAKVGHKIADTAFFVYKTHIAMTEERIITRVVVTTSEKHDGK